MICYSLVRSDFHAGLSEIGHRGCTPHELSKLSPLLCAQEMCFWMLKIGFSKNSFVNSCIDRNLSGTVRTAAVLAVAGVASACVSTLGWVPINLP